MQLQTGYVLWFYLILKLPFSCEEVTSPFISKINVN